MSTRTRRWRSCRAAAGYRPGLPGVADRPPTIWQAYQAVRRTGTPEGW